MGTDRVTPSSSMLEWVRALGLARKGHVGKGTGARPTRPQDPVVAAHDLGVLRKRLADLVGTVDPADAEAVAALRGSLLQEIVLWEFGSDFRRSPDFAPMLEGIERAFVADPQAVVRLSRLIRFLQG